MKDQIDVLTLLLHLISFKEDYGLGERKRVENVILLGHIITVFSLINGPVT